VAVGALDRVRRAVLEPEGREARVARAVDLVVDPDALAGLVGVAHHIEAEQDHRLVVQLALEQLRAQDGALGRHAVLHGAVHGPVEGLHRGGLWLGVPEEVVETLVGKAAAGHRHHSGAEVVQCLAATDRVDVGESHRLGGLELDRAE
jgi:hypothetical protein